jgi:hypothetical protein
LNKVTDLSWLPTSTESDDPAAIQAHAGLNLKEKWGIHPPVSCTGCHR